MGHFTHVSLSPADPILGLMAAFHADPRPKKVNLGIGVYKTEDLSTPILSCVKEAERHLLEREETKEYFPIEGSQEFLELVAELVLGKELWSSKKANLSLFQTLGGTGGLRLAGDFLKEEVGSTIYISEPSWPNHRAVFTQCGLCVYSYPYYDSKENRLEFDACYEALKKLPSGSIIVLHACCHNPSGADLHQAQWALLADLCVEKGFIPFFDAAYIGFGDGLKQDVKAIELFVNKGLEVIVAVSFSKNFSLYSERIGALLFLTDSKQTAERVTSKVKVLIRRSYSNPPRHGASVVAQILQDSSLRTLWELELSEMRRRIGEVREEFVEALREKVDKKKYGYLLQSKGLFTYCALDKKQVDKMIQNYGIYLTSDGRINIAGLNAKNIDYVVDAIATATRGQ